MDKVLLIDPEGKSLGEVTLEWAQRVADERYGMDLVEVRPGTFKILDTGKLKYEASKRKQQKAKQIKEMKFKLNIGENDYRTKVNHIRKFIEAGHPVRVVIWFSGREVSRPEAGIFLMESIAIEVLDLGVTVSMNRELQGKNMFMSIQPGAKKL